MKVYQQVALSVSYLFVHDIIPSSWGSSWHKTARAVAKPATLSPLNAAPIASPSVRLCKPSPMMTIHVTEPMVSLCCCLLWWLCWWFIGTRSASNFATTSGSEKWTSVKCFSYNGYDICVGSAAADLKFSWQWVGMLWSSWLWHPVDT